MPQLHLNRFARYLIICVFSLLAFAPVEAASDKDEIKSVIENQLNAFAADDGSKAYSYAAPIVQRAFPTVEVFMNMVTKGYPPVYRNTSRIFGDVFQDGLGRPAMRVVLTGQDGKRYEAIYSMEKQQDGTWKISGCVVLVIPSQEV
jgi:Domain of unknown function (DUF4864)